uniref:Uncharacterized protein n=1 Tax=Alexandrium catenella TaxID=2925 RepID=A0A7S1R803_ALECA
MDNLLKPGAPGGGRDEESFSEVSDEECVEAAVAGSVQREQKDRTSKRPCKAKRLRYKTLVEKYMDIVRTDPVNFDMNAVDIPLFVTADPKLEAKFKARLQNYAETLLSQPPVPDLAAGDRGRAMHEPASSSTDVDRVPAGAANNSFSIPLQASAMQYAGPFGNAGPFGRGSSSSQAPNPGAWQRLPAQFGRGGPFAYQQLSASQQWGYQRMSL